MVMKDIILPTIKPYSYKITGNSFFCGPKWNILFNDAPVKVLACTGFSESDIKKFVAALNGAYLIGYSDCIVHECV